VVVVVVVVFISLLSLKFKHNPDMIIASSDMQKILTYYLK